MRKILALVFVISLALSLAACSSGGNGGASASGSKAASLPKNIEVQVAAAAGGGTDVMARTFSAYVSQQSGSNLTVVNNTDGGGVVSFETVRNAKPDGSVIMFFHTTMLIKTATGIYDKYADEDFTIIAASRYTSKADRVLLVPATSDVKTLDELIAKAKANPGKLLFGVETGGVVHVLTGMFSKAADIDIKFVEAGPDTEKLTALVGGSIDACFVSPNQAKQYVDSGKTIALAVVSRDSKGERGDVLPDVPSFQEQGVDFSFATVNFILGPKGMDPELVQAISKYFVDGSKEDEVNKVLGPAGFQMEFFEYDEGVARVKAQQQEINAIVEELGLKK